MMQPRKNVRTQGKSGKTLLGVEFSVRSKDRMYACIKMAIRFLLPVDF